DLADDLIERAELIVSPLHRAAGFDKSLLLVFRLSHGTAQTLTNNEVVMALPAEARTVATTMATRAEAAPLSNVAWCACADLVRRGTSNEASDRSASSRSWRSSKFCCEGSARYASRADVASPVAPDI